MSEVDRVQSTTTFNEMNLLDGSFIRGLQVGAEAGQHIDISIANMSMAGLANYIGDWESGKSENSKLYGAITFNALEASNAGYTYTTYGNTSTGGLKPNTATMQGSIVENATATTFSTVNSTTGKYNMKVMTKDMANRVVTTFQNLSGGDATTVATTKDFNSLNAFIKGALQIVSSQRSDLGAIQNRLEHTINNLDNIVENTQSAEAEIRDTDIATEMVTYSNNNILQQAGTSMLSQANQSNQLALSLLG